MSYFHDCHKQANVVMGTKSVLLFQAEICGSNEVFLPLTCMSHAVTVTWKASPC